MKTDKRYQGYYDFLSANVISPFYEKRLNVIKKMSLNKVLMSKNPYLSKAKNFATVGDLVTSMIDGFLYAQEETVFGNLLELFAIHVSEKLHGGFKSKLKSIDLEFARDNKYYIVGIKSGTNWGNSDQLNKMRDNFIKARQTLRDGGEEREIIAVNGCIYGKDGNPLKNKKRVNISGKMVDIDMEPDAVYYKYAGQDFWLFISGDDMLYQEIIKPIDEEARQRDDIFKKAYTSKVNEMTEDFLKDFMTKDMQIDWIKLVDHVSKRAPKKAKKGSADEGKMLFEMTSESE
jgi:site-specific DNA-methyltransferase (cytosine-N4-specific)